MEAAVIIAKCEKSGQSFAIRAEKERNSWLFTWTFKINEKVMRKEGYEKTRIGGAIDLTQDYPGCPHCNAMSFFQCGACNKISCYDHKNEIVKCHWCGNSSTLSIVESFDKIAGGEF